ncbi:unannotated protein [freshwater metagenome]|uniref:Unannotated protein n=1 Tax=freshwater metagenome TaxID=449393 RepID=A0A6J6HYK2_9ZZZZ
MLESLEGLALGCRNVGRAGKVVDVPNIGVERCDVEITHQCQRSLGVCLEPLGAGGRKAVEPFKLVAVVRVIECAPVWNVKRPHPHTIDGGTDGPGFGGILEFGHVSETDLNVFGRLF